MGIQCARRPPLERRVLAATTRGIRSVVIRPAVVYGRAGGIPAMLINLAHQYGAARFMGRDENLMRSATLRESSLISTRDRY